MQLRCGCPVPRRLCNVGARGQGLIKTVKIANSPGHLPVRQTCGTGARKQQYGQATPTRPSPAPLGLERPWRPECAVFHCPTARWPCRTSLGTVTTWVGCCGDRDKRRPPLGNGGEGEGGRSFRANLPRSLQRRHRLRFRCTASSHRLSYRPSR